MDRNSQQSGFGFKVFRKVFFVVSVFAFFNTNSLLSQVLAGPFPIQGSNDICVDLPINYTTNFNPNAQYNWRAVNGQILSGQNTPAVTAVWGDPGANQLILEVQTGAAIHRDTIAILASQPTPINMGPDGALCGQGLMLTPGPGFVSYLWQSGGAADSIYPQIPGTYWCRVTDLHGCQSCDTVHLSSGVPQPSLFPAGPIEFCEGNSEMLFGPSGYADYLWNGLSGGQTAIVSQTQTVILTVVDSLGCSNSTVSTQVTAIPLPSPTITLMGNVLTTDPAPSYEWYLNGNSTGLTTQTITVTSSGNYTVKVTNDDDCTGTSASFFYTNPSTAIGSEALQQMTVSPNPSNGRFHLELPSDWSASTVQVALYDGTGRIVEASILQQAHRIDVDASNLAAGIYTLSANSQEGGASARVVVAH
jgi:hypothetical protein